LKFWDKLDERLAKIRQEAKGDAVKLTKYVFLHHLMLYLYSCLVQGFSPRLDA
jgi:hypothetical protein